MTDQDRILTLERQLLELSGRLSVAETKIDGQLATREHVNALILPMNEVILRVENAVTVLTRDYQELNAAHKQLLQERSGREQREYEERIAQQNREHQERIAQIQIETDAKVAAAKDATLWALVEKKWAPLGGFMLTGAGVMAMLFELARFILSAHGVKFGP